MQSNDALELSEEWACEAAVTRDCFIIGFDSEYTKEGHGQNRIISYQFYGIAPDGYWTAIYEPDSKAQERFALDELLKWFLEAGRAAKKFAARPRQILLCAHFAIAEVTSLQGGDELLRKVDHISKGLVSLQAPIEVSYYDAHRNKHRVDVHLRDTVLLAPEGKKNLAALGDVLGLKKIHLEESDIIAMDELRLRDRELFERYALRDAEIAARYVQKIALFTKEFLGIDDLLNVPMTIAMMAVNLVFKVWRDQKIAEDSVLGTVTKWRNKRREITLQEERNAFEGLATETYWGGRNEAYFYGPVPESDYTDLDLVSAYSTALSTIGMPEWANARQLTSLDQLNFDAMGFATVKFEFPAAVRFPCLPVSYENGLIFPRKGKSSATHFEILLALDLGARMELVRGCIVPLNRSCCPFAEVSRTVKAARAAAREAYGKSSLEELLIKTIGNSVYGKTAQGIRDKTVFDTRKGESRRMPAGRLTNPFIAAYTTGLVRAALGEIINNVPASNLVVSATTDGFLTDYPTARIQHLCDGTICKFLSEEGGLSALGQPLLEKKHRATELVCWKTRGQASVGEVEDSTPVLAKGGFQLRGLSSSEAARHLVKLLLSREYGSVNVQSSLRSIRDIYEEGGDLTGIERMVKLTMDSDWKRFPFDCGMASLHDGKHVFFNTRPVESIQEFEHVRLCWKEFYHIHKEPLKTAETLRAFLDRVAVRKHGKFQLPFGEAVVTVLRKAFLVAYKRNLCGLDGGLSNRELATWLTEGGYTTDTREVENAARPDAWFRERCVEPTRAALEFVQFVRQRLPAFAPEPLFATSW